MKKLLLLSAAMMLAGCNSSPSEGDVEDFLQPKFAPCLNIKVTDIDKTNGYEEDGHYRVEYTYVIKLKDPSKLKDFLTAYEEEKQSIDAFQQAVRDKEQYVKNLRKEIERLHQEHYNRMPPQLANYFAGRLPRLPWPEERQYAAAVDEWKAQNPLPSQIQELQDEIKQIDEEFAKRPVPKVKFYRNSDSFMLGHYLKGCPLDTRANFVPTIFPQAIEARNTQDERAWFKAHDFQMKGAVTMRKTEKGWRALRS